MATRPIQLWLRLRPNTVALAGIQYSTETGIRCSPNHAQPTGLGWYTSPYSPVKQMVHSYRPDPNPTGPDLYNLHAYHTQKDEIFIVFSAYFAKFCIFLSHSAATRLIWWAILYELYCNLVLFSASNFLWTHAQRASMLFFCRCFLQVILWQPQLAKRLNGSSRNFHTWQILGTICERTRSIYSWPS